MTPINPFVFAVIAAALVVLGPLLAMRQSPRQKQLERLRAAALAGGLRVSIEPGLQPPGSVIYLLPWRLEDRARGLQLRAAFDDATGWRVEAGARDAGHAAALLAALAGLPAGVRRLDARQDGIALHWRERGAVEGIAAMALALARVRDLLAG